MAGSRGRKVDASRYAMVPRNDVPRSAFDTSYTHKTTFDAGWLIPVHVDEVLPGDSIRLRMNAFARLATPITPVMDNLILESFFFFVPYRLLWANWERFMGEKANLSDTTEFLVPQIEFSALELATGVTSPALADYMGLTMNGEVSGSISVSALPFRAYRKAYADWFRDQDLIALAPVEPDTGDGPDSGSDYQFPFKRGKRHDYFTTCRPWPAKPVNLDAFSAMGRFDPGQNMVLPQGGAPVSGLGVAPSMVQSEGSQDIRMTGDRVVTATKWYNTGVVPFLMQAHGDDIPNVRVLVNDMRTANVVQVLLERNARGGTRYAEIIRSHFGVMSPDARLQRSEYLGGGRTYVNVSPVAQQSATGITGGSTVLGELGGVGTAVASNHGFSQSFTEHGVILGLVSVRADLSYQQGVERMWWRKTVYDFYWPALAHLGEQAVLSQEIFCDGNALDTSVFGYQERWAEYKGKVSRISGRFRSQAAGSLDIWHFSQEFSSRPALGQTFIQEDPPVDRVLQVGGEGNEQFLLDAMFDIRYARCMPMYSIPGMGPRL